MATTNEEVLDHLRELRTSVSTAIGAVKDWQDHGTKLKAGNQNEALALVTTIPTERQHGDDCAVCSAWDGSIAISDDN